jgi:oxygen-independent coproporphyrinogen-3 oxidase
LTRHAPVTAPGEPLPPWLWPGAAYVHVPFCLHHCCYCDFAVAAGQDHLIDLYTEALAAEMRTLERPQPIDTLFLGGGTPTHLSPCQLERLLRAVLDWLPLRPGHEFSVEANPATLTAEKVGVLAAHGVNRISLGAQSFQPEVLRLLERDHADGDICRAVAVALKEIDKVSVDLIFGVPEQTTEQWAADLAQAVALGVGHVSTYGLTYEKGTRLWKDRQRGRVQALDEQAELDMYLRAVDALTAAGFEHYEISSFARPGSHCRHNQVYWANYAYFGFGLGAARYIQGRRDVNTRDLQGYLRKALAGEVTVMQSEQLSDEERARETLCLNLRRGEGVDREKFRRQTSFDVDALAGEVLRRHVEHGLLDDDGCRVRLTRAGKCVADAVVSCLL